MKVESENNTLGIVSESHTWNINNMIQFFLIIELVYSTRPENENQVTAAKKSVRCLKNKA